MSDAPPLHVISYFALRMSLYADTHALGSFWAEVLGGVLYEDNGPEVPEVLVSTGEGSGPGLLFLPVPEGKTIKNRLHLDLQPQGRSRDEEVVRLLGLGAKLIEDFRKLDGTGWAVMIDIERMLSPTAPPRRPPAFRKLNAVAVIGARILLGPHAVQPRTACSRHIRAGRMSRGTHTGRQVYTCG